MTGCAHQPLSGTKVALAKTRHATHHDAVMVSGKPSPLTDLGPRVTLSHVLGATRCATPQCGHGVKMVGQSRSPNVPPAIDGKRNNVQGTIQCTCGVYDYLEG